MKTPYGLRVISQADGPLLPGHSGVYCYGGSWFLNDAANYLLDSYLLDLKTGEPINLTARNRVSHYNGGLFFLPNGRGLGFMSLINGVSKPFVMDLDGRNKRDLSGKDAGFAYGYRQDFNLYPAFLWSPGMLAKRSCSSIRLHAGLGKSRANPPQTTHAKSLSLKGKADSSVYPRRA